MAGEINKLRDQLADTIEAMIRAVVNDSDGFVAADEPDVDGPDVLVENADRRKRFVRFRAEPTPGATLRRCCEIAIEAADRLGDQVSMTYNGTELVARPGMDVGDMALSFSEKRGEP